MISLFRWLLKYGPHIWTVVEKVWDRLSDEHKVWIKNLLETYGKAGSGKNRDEELLAKAELLAVKLGELDVSKSEDMQKRRATWNDRLASLRQGITLLPLMEPKQRKVKSAELSNKLDNLLMDVVTSFMEPEPAVTVS